MEDITPASILADYTGQFEIGPTDLVDAYHRTRDTEGQFWQCIAAGMTPRTHEFWIGFINSGSVVQRTGVNRYNERRRGDGKLTEWILVRRGEPCPEQGSSVSEPHEP